MERRTVLGAVVGLGTLSGCLRTVLEDQNGDHGGERLHASGEIDVVVDDEPVDLTRPRYQAEHAENHSLAFHMHEGSDAWYMEGREPVTVGEGLDLLPHVAFEAVSSGYRLEIDDDAYDEREDGTEILASVNGEPVDPFAYELQDGDEIVIEVTTNA